MGRFKILSILLLVMVVSIVLSNVYLYHMSYYGHPFLDVISRSPSTTASNQLLYRFDISFNVKGEHNTGDYNISEEAKLTQGLEYEEVPVNVTTTLQSSGNLSNTRLEDTRWNNFTEHRLPAPLTDDSRTKISPVTNVPRTPRTHKRRQFSGYLLILKIYEQQTMATGNLLQLQCFASKLNLSVVQPFMKDSCFATPLDEAKQRHMLQLDDVYDMTEWSKYAEGEGYAPLVKWEEFTKHAPSNVILVQMRYPSLKEVKELRGSGAIFPHPLSEGNNGYKEGCSNKAAERTKKALAKRNFRVVRRVCYNFKSGDDIPLQMYQDDMSGAREGHHNVTVIIDEWRGFGENQRLLIKENICSGSASYRDQVHSSSKVTRDARLYADKYLNQNGGTDYLGVIVRYEMTALTHKTGGKGDPNAVIPWCIKETLREITKMKHVTELEETFLSVDIGKYGSRSFLSHNYYGHKEDMESFVSQVYDNKMRFADWEKSFEGVVEKVDTGYIAKVQQAIVARARCVLFVGGGSFQQHALHQYQELHPNSKEWCIKVVKKCTSQYRPITS